MTKEPLKLKWVVLSGGFTGDGSSVHRMYENEYGNRILIFNSYEAAQGHVVKNKIGKHSLIAEVVLEALPALELRRPGGDVIYYSEAT